jgi:hypothetical protein
MTASHQPAYGTGIIPSIVAVTAFAAVKQTESLCDLYRLEMEQAAQAQKEQGTITTALAQSAEDTIYEQGNATQQNAFGTLVQGVVATSSPAVASGWDICRSLGQTDLSTAVDNVEKAKTALEGQDQKPILGNQPQDARQFTTAELQTLTHADFREPQDEETMTKLKQLGSWKSAGRAPNDPNPLSPEESAARAQIHKDVTARIKAQAKKAEGASTARSGFTDHISRRIEGIGSGLAPAISSNWQLNAANNQKAQAANQATQTRNQFVNDSAQANVQTQKQTSSSILDDERSVMQNVIGGLAQASSRA